MEPRPMERAPEPSAYRPMHWDHIKRESRAACAKFGPVLRKITVSVEHDVHGGRVPDLNIPQRPR